MRFFVLIFCFACLLFGQNIQRVMSNIPPAKEHYINLESEICSSTCLRVLLKNDMLISFLTQFDKAYADEDLAMIYSNLLGGVSYASEQNIIAVIIPKRVIKSYSKIVQNALTGYVLEKNLKLSLKFINSGDENPASLQNAMNSARKMGARVFIAPLTLNGAKSLNSLIYANEIAYIPTVNISSMPEAKANLIFGGVDYEAQLSKLIKLSGEKITAFSDGSELGEWLNTKVLQLSSGMIYTEKLRGKDIKLENQISKPHKINKSYVFLNLPLIKATLIATQLKGFEVTPAGFLSTQINYNPHLLTMIEAKDRSNFLIANSIQPSSEPIAASQALFGINLTYNFIAYSSLIGLDHLYQTLIDDAHKKGFDENIVNKQVAYETEIFKPVAYEFVKNETISSGILEGLE